MNNYLIRILDCIFSAVGFGRTIKQLQKVQRRLRRGCMDLDLYHIMTDYASSANPV